MVLVTEADIRRTISYNSFVRGKGYWEGNRVHDLKNEALNNGTELVMARVRGSRRNVYSVSITLSRDPGKKHTDIEGDCSCPVGWQCKHVAAALFELIEERGNVESPVPKPSTFGRLQQNLQAMAATARTETAPAKPDAGSTLDPGLENWINQVARAARLPTADTGEIPQSVLYLLDLREERDRPYLHISTVYVRRLKIGGYGKAYPAANPNANYVVEEDRLLWRWLDVLRVSPHSYRGEHQVRNNAEAGELMRALLASGRCHWRDKDAPPLVQGEPCRVEMDWEVLEDGSQRPGLHLPETMTVLPLAPPWYVDPVNHQCGLIETGLPAQVAGMLLEAPSLPPEQAEAVSQVLARRVPDLPRPKALRKVRQQDLEPVPVLYLGNQEYRLKGYYFYRFEDNQVELPFARLSFLYGEHKIPAWPEEDAPVTYYNRTRGELVQLVRNRVLESEARRQLSTYSLVPLSSYYLYDSLQVPAENRYDHIIGELAAQHDEAGIHNALVRFSLDVVPKLRAAGWKVEMAEDYLFRVVDEDLLDEWYADIKEGTGIDWFGLELGITIDGERINLLPVLVEMLRAIPNAEALAEVRALPDDALLTPRLEDGRILPLAVGRVRDIIDILIELLDQDPLDEDGRLRLQNLRAAQLVELEAAMGAARLRWLGGERLLELGRKLKDFQGIRTVQLPADFATELRPYQQDGLNWLQFLREYGLGGILADDMGLGKTVQALAHILTEKHSGSMDKPCMVIAPTSLMFNWRMEAKRFAPALKVLTLHGPQRREWFEQIPHHDVVLTTYPLLPRDKDALLENEYHLLILDEAQNIKNPKAKASQIAHQIRASHRLCLTGTPLENHLGELWSLCHFLMPGLLGDAPSFRNLFRTPIEKEGDSHRGQVLARRIKPFLLRRTKQEVVTELPAKTEIIRSVELEGAQLDLYETIRLTMHDKVRREIASKGMARSQIVILDALLKLRQICCDPRLLKLEAAKKVGHSAKLQLLMDILPEMVEEGRKILLFSQFTSMLSLIEEELHKHRLGYVKLTGQTRKREETIAAFQHGDIPIFLISLKAGGTGLNLTAADTVIHYDPWWNPAVENQATDRAHRIGQDKKVFVYKLLTAGTVEEKIQELQKRKQEMADALFSGKRKSGAQLSSEDLEALFEPL